MRQVFSNHSEVAHVFAQRTQNSGRAGNIFFEGNTIYSYGYHFPVARFLDDDTVLFTLDSYSNSTAKHINIISGALSHYDVVYTYDMDNTKRSLERFSSVIKYNFKKLAKARKPEIYIDAIMSILGILRKYVDTLGVKVYKKDYPELYDLLKRGKDYFSPELIQKIKERQKRDAKRAATKLAEKLTKWREFDKDTPRHISNGQFAYLRYNASTGNVETSKGVNIPHDEAKVLYLMWVRYPEHVIGRKVQYYTINKCTEDSLTAGCHTIRFSEAQAIAETLNW